MLLFFLIIIIIITIVLLLILKSNYNKRVASNYALQKRVKGSKFYSCPSILLRFFFVLCNALCCARHCIVQGIVLCKALCCARRCVVQGVVLCKALCCARRCVVQGVVLCKALCCARHCVVQGVVLCKALCCARLCVKFLPTVIVTQTSSDFNSIFWEVIIIFFLLHVCFRICYCSYSYMVLCIQKVLLKRKSTSSPLQYILLINIVYYM